MNKIIKITRYIVIIILYLSGIPFLIRELYQRNKITIINFHDIPHESADKIFKYLSKKYNIIPLKLFVDLVSNKKIDKRLIPSKALIITIDDGLKQNFKLYNDIKTNKIPITIFLVTGIIGTNRGFWWNHNFTGHSTENLKKFSDKERLIKLKENGFIETKEWGYRESLSFDEIRKMKDFVDFQSHSVSHPILPMCDNNKALYEIKASKEYLISNFEFEIYAFAYPNGNHSKREEKMIKSEGYQCALTTINGYNTINSNLFRLKRISGGMGKTVLETAVKTSGLWEFVRNIFY